MPDKPAAEVDIDERLVRALVSSQAAHIAGDLPLSHVADGWDCSVWRLGDHWAVRLPRRAVAAPLVRNEQDVLAGIAARLRDSGAAIGIPAPVIEGRPGFGYPWPWSVVPWFDGTSGLRVPRADRAGWAAPLAHALIALHEPAPAGHPVNPVRGVPLAQRAEAVSGRFDSLRGRVADASLRRLRERWDAALAAPAWSRAPVWIHGDLHPGNLVARGSDLSAIIDFGDVTAGDPAYDLAVAWVAFDPAGRSAFRSAIGVRYDSPTWIRAHGWAVAVTLMLLDQSDDNPEYAALGVEAMAELLG